MGLIIVPSDFVGKYTLVKGKYVDKMIADYIAKYEERYLMELLGIELFDLFKADVLANAPDKFPADPIYKVLYDPIREQKQDCNSLMLSDGIKDMLLGFLYFEIGRDQDVKQTMSGAQKTKSENAEPPAYGEWDIWGRYNEAVKSYTTIQWYAGDDSVTYPGYRGVKKQISYW